MPEFVCPNCQKELDTIECRVTHFLVYSEDLERYRWSETSSLDDPGAYYCPECSSCIPDEEIREVVVEASE